MTLVKLCELEDIADREAKGFIGRVDGKQRNIFAVRKADNYYVYLNHCPHAGALIDHIQGKFFNGDGTLLRCGMHGALFQIEDGACTDGPCMGKGLTPVPSEAKADGLYIEET
jgi:nitrite reductase/ring-hydroxylating ferredoxin subunit